MSKREKMHHTNGRTKPKLARRISRESASLPETLTRRTPPFLSLASHASGVGPRSELTTNAVFVHVHGIAATADNRRVPGALHGARSGGTVLRVVLAFTAAETPVRAAHDAAYATQNKGGRGRQGRCTGRPSMVLEEPLTHVQSGDGFRFAPSAVTGRHPAFDDMKGFSLTPCRTERRRTRSRRRHRQPGSPADAAPRERRNQPRRANARATPRVRVRCFRAEKRRGRGVIQVK